MANKATWPKLMHCNVEKSIKGCTNQIHRLCDELLMEVLLRLPDCKSVVQCKCVCKLWAAVASHPRFFDLFFRHKLEHGIHNEAFAIIMRYVWNLPDRSEFNKLYKEFEGFFKPSIFNSQDSCFSSLPFLREDNVLLIASCQDLLLYCKQENGKSDFYISNVQTRQYVKLPSSPHYYEMERLLVGFICDPIYSCGREVFVNASCHYSIVFLRYPYWALTPATKFSIQLYSSHCDSRWCDRVLSTQTPCTLLPPEPLRGFCFDFDGKLHFCGIEGFFGFDHNKIDFNEEIPCHFIEWPSRGLHQVGVSRGTLHVCTYIDDLYVWILEDYKAGNWMLQHRVTLSDWVPRGPWMTKKLKKFNLYPGQLRDQRLVNVLCINPSNSDVIYLHVPGCIFLCNLSTKTMELACRVPVAIAKSCRHYLNRFYVFPVRFQIWPTPLLPFVKGLKVGTNDSSIRCCGFLAQG